jgi:predicted esterase
MCPLVTIYLNNMKLNLNHLFIIILFITKSFSSAAQENILETSRANANKLIDKIQNDKAINADSAFKLISNWNVYPTIKGGKDYLFYYTDSLFGKVPFRVFVPASYNNTRKSTCVLLLHGAVGQSSFADADSVQKFDDDIIFSILKKQDNIIIRPIGDPKKQFSWVVHKAGLARRDAPNFTYQTLTNIIASVKKQFNIDDSKVFAFGHSDGSDGTIGLGVYTPNQFAGFIAYNSMFDNIFARDFYIRNIVNSPLYVVHSDLDDLRPIQQTHIIMDWLKDKHDHLIYKEYIGYQHYDKHLNTDIPYTSVFINSVSRNLFKNKIYWECYSDKIYNSYAWIKLTSIDTGGNRAAWHQSLTFPNYNKIKKEIDTRYRQYQGLNKSAAVKVTFFNNTFNLEISGITEAEIMISPMMVNIERPVVININGKQVFAGKVQADKNFMLQNFKNSFDRDAIWVSSIKVKVE